MLAILLIIIVDAPLQPKTWIMTPHRSVPVPRITREPGGTMIVFTPA